MKKLIYFVLFVIVFASCSKAIIDDTPNEESQITLRWFPSHSIDTFEKNRIALEWCLSYLGANVAEQSVLTGIHYSNPTVTLDVESLGFSDEAVNQLKKLHDIFKNSEEYRTHNAFDLGKYIAMTLGSSYHYYKITGAPAHIDSYTTAYHFNALQGYIDNSSISLPGVHRIISYSPLDTSERQAFISSEIDPATNEIKEFETLERMPNGKPKFAVFDADGFLIPNADGAVSAAGKPGKCLWCHEVSIQTLFTDQNDFTGFLSFTQLTDTLNFYNFQLRNYQDNLWQNPNIQNKALHTNMELSYISYMEPSAERLAKEWNLSEGQVQDLLASIPTHTHSEFPFLGTLYHRNDIDSFAPYATIQPPSSIREQSIHEPNLLND